MSSELEAERRSECLGHLVKRRAGLKSGITRNLNDILAIVDEVDCGRLLPIQDEFDTKFESINAILADMNVDYDRILYMMTEDDEAMKAKEYMNCIEEMIKSVKCRVDTLFVSDIITPEESASRSGSMSSRSSSRAKAAAQAAGLTVAAERLKDVQQLELEELLLKQKKEALKIEIQVASANAEMNSYEQRERSHHGSRHGSRHGSSYGSRPSICHEYGSTTDIKSRLRDIALKDEYVGHDVPDVDNNVVRYTDNHMKVSDDHVMKNADSNVQNVAHDMHIADVNVVQGAVHNVVQNVHDHVAQSVYHNVAQNADGNVVQNIAGNVAHTVNAGIDAYNDYDNVQGSGQVLEPMYSSVLGMQEHTYRGANVSAQMPNHDNVAITAAVVTKPNVSTYHYGQNTVKVSQTSTANSVGVPMYPNVQRQAQISSIGNGNIMSTAESNYPIPHNVQKPLLVSNGVTTAHASSRAHINVVQGSPPVSNTTHVPVSNVCNTTATCPYGNIPNMPSFQLNPYAVPWQQQHQLLAESLNRPKVELLKFDGDPFKYWLFCRQFDNVNGSNPDCAYKLTLLIQLCTGKAKQAIEHCAAMDPMEGFTRARAILSDRFGNEFLIAEKWIGKIVNGPVVGARNNAALQDLADDLHSCVGNLTAINQLHELNTQGTLKKIVDRLPQFARIRWVKEVQNIRRKTRGNPVITDLMTFVSRLAVECNDPVYGRCTDTDKENVKSSMKRPPRTTSFNVAADKQAPRTTTNYTPTSQTPGKTSTNFGVCILCKGHHSSLFRCNSFKSMSVDERRKYVMNEKLCFNCLEKGHGSLKCTLARTCSVPECGKKHTKFLHPITVTRQPDNPQADVKADKPSVSATCNATGAGIVGRVALPILPVKIRAPNTGHQTIVHALLDNGSTNTFGTEELAEELHLERSPQTLNLTTLDRQDTEVTTYSRQSGDSATR